MSQSEGPIVAGTAALLLIGNELLTGKIREDNLQPLAQLLRALGVDLTLVTVVRDDIATIAAEVNRLRYLADVVFTSGGIGPTHDDVTVEAVAQAFGVQLETPPHLAARLNRAYGTNCTPAHLRMAQVPRGSVLLEDMDHGWPLVRMGNVWLLPGIPELFRSRLKIVRTCLRGRTSYCSEWVKLLLEEVELKEHLDAVVAEHPEVEIGSYPKWSSSEYKTQVTFDAQNSDLVRRALSSLLARLPKSAVAATSEPTTP